jgi:glycosyltransferase involved in cell wall biosynthesis
VLAATGDAVVILASDLQHPPELIPEFIEQWEAGFQVVLGLRAKRQESRILVALRKLYYKFLRYISGEFIMHETAIHLGILCAALGLNLFGQVAGFRFTG